MKSAKERLPKGFSRRASGSLRVQIRVAGFTETRTFPLQAETTSDRKRQKAEAEAWAGETRRRIMGGVHVSTHDAERTSLASCLERYGREGLKGDVANADKDRDRIKILLKDPISRKMLAQLRKTDIAALRDRLLEAGFLRNADRLARKHEKTGALSVDRIADIRSLRDLSREVKQANVEERSKIEARVVEIAAREGVRYPARTTVGNVVQLVNRALTHAGQTMDGVPDVSGVPMPAGSPGRDRRVTDDEMSVLTAKGSDELMPLIIRFAVATTFRRERLLSCRTSHFRRIAAGRLAIAFPKASSTRKKRTGIVPVTKEIADLVLHALRLQGYESLESAPDVDLFPITLQAFESRWKRLLAAGGIDDLHFHDFRHEGTSRLFERGLTTAEVMSVTGHSTQEMVDRYAHYSAALVLDKLERGEDASALLAQIMFLVEQFAGAGGDRRALADILTHNRQIG